MADYSPVLDFAVYQSYMDLDQKQTIQAEYIWIGGAGELRCKTKSITKQCFGVKDYPIWNFDGSSTGQAPGDNSEVYLKPVAVYPDPFRRGKNVMVLCECVLPLSDFTMEMKPQVPFNTRAAAVKILEKVKEHVPWFGIEQEYTLFYSDGRTPFGWPRNGFPGPQGPYYCSAGAENAFGRRIADAHYRACLYAGITISGINAEVMPGQWEYQVGPCVGISSGDELIMSRYIMQRVCEDFNVIVSFDPKPIEGDWNGTGCHTNFSTKAMREDNGFEVIKAAMVNMEKAHDKHIKLYGEGNERRLTGHHETASMDKFSWGVADRGASIRVSQETFLTKKGYFEDRRPASNMDPYVVTSLIAETVLLRKPTSRL